MNCKLLLSGLLFAALLSGCGSPPKPCEPLGKGEAVNPLVAVVTHSGGNNAAPQK